MKEGTLNSFLTHGSTLIPEQKLLIRRYRQAFEAVMKRILKAGWAGLGVEGLGCGGGGVGGDLRKLRILVGLGEFWVLRAEVCGSMGDAHGLRKKFKFGGR